ncbi:hypothetical protein [Phyllobacterium sp. K27]
MTAPSSRKMWFQKELTELNKFDWRDAVNAVTEWKRETVVGRVAVKIADFYNPELGYAFPSLSRLAAELNYTDEKVSTAISKLRKGGALKKIHRNDVPDHIAPKKGERGLFFKLDFMWAFEVGEIIRNPAYAKGVESAALKAGRLRSQRSKITVTDNNSFTVTDNNNVYGHRKVDTYLETLGTPKTASTDQNLALSSSDDNPIDPPDDVEVARDWLTQQGVDPSRIETALHKLMSFNLCQRDLKNMKRRAA